MICCITLIFLLVNCLFINFLSHPLSNDKKDSKHVHLFVVLVIVGDTGSKVKQTDLTTKTELGTCITSQTYMTGSDMTDVFMNCDPQV